MIMEIVGHITAGFRVLSSRGEVRIYRIDKSSFSKQNILKAVITLH